MDANEENEGKALVHEPVVLSGWAHVWDVLSKTFWRIEDGLATLCGLNDSKYEWALRQHYYEERLREEAAVEQEEARARNERVRLEAIEGGVAQEMVREDEVKLGGAAIRSNSVLPVR